MDYDILKIFHGKINSNDPFYQYNITPGIDDGWYGAIFEARGYGIPIASFGDTSDKLVFHPGHLGYNFDYAWGNGSWTDRSCWNKKVDKTIISEANSRIFNIAKLLCKKYKVHLVNVSGTCKGYLSTQLFESKNLEDNYDVFKENNYLTDDLVLFVYGINMSDKDHLENISTSD